MKLVSWNVNGLRAALKGDALPRYLEEEDADVVCLQEIKANPEQVEFAWPGEHVHWNPAERKGYSGTLVCSKRAPLSVRRGIGVPEGDAEGRVITLEFGSFFLVNVYTPNAKRDLSRLRFRAEVWDPAFLAFLRRLKRRKPVAVCGDLNVAHKAIDLKNAAANRRNAGFTPEERAGMDAYVRAGFVDTFRQFEKGGGHYTWWSQRLGARARNIGWRIDYFLVSRKLRPNLADAFIRPDVTGSDHCPVGVVLRGE